MTIVHLSRSDIGLRNSRPVPTHSKSKVILHYTTGNNIGNPDPRKWWKSIQAYHMDSLGWSDIGYNFGIAKGPDDHSAYILDGRGKSAVGAHCPGQNSTSIGIAFLGEDNPNVVDLTPGVKAAFKQLIGSFGNLPVYGHRDFIKTLCPGQEITNWIRDGLPLELGQKEAKMIAIEPIGSVTDPNTAGGGWVVGARGHVYAFGGAPWLGVWDDATRADKNRKCVALVPNRHGVGYWLVSNYGEIYAFGGVPHLGNYNRQAWGEGVIIGAYANDRGGYTLVRDDGLNLNTYNFVAY